MVFVELRSLPISWKLMNTNAIATLSSNLCEKLSTLPKVEAGNDYQRMKLKDNTASGKT